jgi:hypothetical protein
LIIPSDFRSIPTLFSSTSLSSFLPFITFSYLRTPDRILTFSISSCHTLIPLHTLLSYLRISDHFRYYPPQVLLPLPYIISPPLVSGLRISDRFLLEFPITLLWIGIPYIYSLSHLLFIPSDFRSIPTISIPSCLHLLPYVNPRHLLLPSDSRSDSDLVNISS